MTAKHTPGPWDASENATPDWCPQATIYSEHDDNHPVALVYESDNNDRHAANAHLIAAAPDMYEALQAVHAAIVAGELTWTRKRQADSDPYHPANTAMSAALAKAEGR